MDIDPQKLYQSGYRAALSGQTRDGDPLPEKTTAWLHGWHDGRCAIARFNKAPLPETPFKGKVEILC